MRTFSATKVPCGAHSAPYPNKKTAFLITPADPCTYVIFGAMGNLSRVKLMSALYHLDVANGLPEGTRILAIGRTDPGIRKNGWRKSEIWSKPKRVTILMNGFSSVSRPYLWEIAKTNAIYAGMIELRQESIQETVRELGYKNYRCHMLWQLKLKTTIYCGQFFVFSILGQAPSLTPLIIDFIDSLLANVCGWVEVMVINL